MFQSLFGKNNVTQNRKLAKKGGVKWKTPVFIVMMRLRNEIFITFPFFMSTENEKKRCVMYVTLSGLRGSKNEAGECRLHFFCFIFVKMTLLFGILGMSTKL